MRAIVPWDWKKWSEYKASMQAKVKLPLHFAAFCDVAWPDYLEAMREGTRRYGPVRAGVYAMTTSVDEKVAGL